MYLLSYNHENILTHTARRILFRIIINFNTRDSDIIFFFVFMKEDCFAYLHFSSQFSFIIIKTLHKKKVLNV